MEQLRIRADRFRKQGRLQDMDMEEIIREVKEGDEMDSRIEESGLASMVEQRQAMEAVKEGLLQIHGLAPNTKQHGIFRIMGENCNRLNNRIRGNGKIAKALDIKEDLDVDCLLYCEHCLNLKHKENKNNLKQMFQRAGMHGGSGTQRPRRKDGTEGTRGWYRINLLRRSHRLYQENRPRQ